jgi:hypothetical protein
MHYWKTGGTNGLWIGHSTSGRGEDSIGVPAGGDHFGPFKSRKQTEQVTEMLNRAYELGREDEFKELWEKGHDVQK